MVQSGMKIGRGMGNAASGGASFCQRASGRSLSGDHQGAPRRIADFATGSCFSLSPARFGGDHLPMPSKAARFFLPGSLAALLGAGVFLAVSSWRDAAPRSAVTLTKSAPALDFPQLGSPAPPTAEETR